MSVPITTHTPTQFFGSMTMADLVPDVDTDLTSSQCLIPLDIAALRIIDGDEIHNLAAIGGLLAEDSNPRLLRTDTSTDPLMRVLWTAENDEIEVQFPPLIVPPDLDASENVIFHAIASREDTTDDCQVDVHAFQTGVGAYAADTEMGGKWAALDGAAAELQERTVTLDAADIAVAPSILTLSLVPDAHTTDDLYLYAAWIEYTRKLRAS